MRPRSILRSSPLALLLIASPAAAERVEIEGGAAHITFGTPDRESTPAVAISLGVGAAINSTFDATLRGHVSVGDGVITALGPHVRQRAGTYAFVGYGPAIASVVGDRDRMMRARGIGLGADLRAGIRFGDVTLTIEALPIWIFASDSLSPESHLRNAVEIGIALGYQR